MQVFYFLISNLNSLILNNHGDCLLNVIDRSLNVKLMNIFNLHFQDNFSLFCLNIFFYLLFVGCTEDACIEVKVSESHMPGEITTQHLVSKT